MTRILTIVFTLAVFSSAFATEPRIYKSYPKLLKVRQSLLTVGPRKKLTYQESIFPKMAPKGEKQAIDKVILPPELIKLL